MTTLESRLSLRYALVSNARTRYAHVLLPPSAASEKVVAVGLHVEPISAGPHAVQVARYTRYPETAKKPAPAPGDHVRLTLPASTPPRPTGAGGASAKAYRLWPVDPATIVVRPEKSCHMAAGAVSGAPSGVAREDWTSPDEDTSTRPPSVTG